MRYKFSKINHCVKLLEGGIYVQIRGLFKNVVSNLVFWHNWSDAFQDILSGTQVTDMWRCETV